MRYRTPKLHNLLDALEKAEKERDHLNADYTRRVFEDFDLRLAAICARLFLQLLLRSARTNGRALCTALRRSTVCSRWRAMQPTRRSKCACRVLISSLRK